MQEKKLTLIFNHFEQEHLGKDVFLVPYYLKKQKGYEVTIVYPLSESNKNLPDVIKGVKLRPLKFRGKATSFFLYKEINFFLYLIANANKIDVLMRFHHTPQTAIMAWIYKSLNSKGKIYVKADMNSKHIIEGPFIGNGIKKLIEKLLYRKFVKKIDIISCETSLIYNMLESSDSPYFDFKHKLVLMPNGFDEEHLNELNINENRFENKENLIITVGRLGSVPKNTEMFLKSLENLDLKNWKVCLIGPIDDSLNEIIETFYNKYPEKKDQIIFTGPIIDKRELWDYYNKSKVFVLTSRWESYALVLNEAKRFRNFLISTEVGAFADLSENGKYGISIEQDSSIQLTRILQKVVDGELNVNVYKKFEPSEMSWYKMVERIKL